MNDIRTEQQTNAHPMVLSLDQLKMVSGGAKKKSSGGVSGGSGGARSARDSSGAQSTR